MFKCTASIFPLLLLTMFMACNTENKPANDRSAEQSNAISSVIFPDTLVDHDLAAVSEQLKMNAAVLNSALPIIKLKGLSNDKASAQDLAIADPQFQANLFDKSSKKAFRNEIFNVYESRPQEVPPAYQGKVLYKVEMYNYGLNLSTTAMVDVASRKVVSINEAPQSQPDIPTYLKDLAMQIAAHNPQVIAALGYQPNESQALMANTKTALNNSRCERSLHLCVAPTFIKDDKALWVIVDLTEYRVVGIRWTNTGTTGSVKRVSERSLKFDKIMECYCKKVTALQKQSWKLNYVLTTSDGMRISEVYYNDKLIINNAKLVDWHVSYSNTDGFGYSDAVGCPEFSQAAVVAVTEPRVSDIVENGQVLGFALEQNFSSEQWPKPCNYNYLQRYEFYLDGRFRAAAASLGRGCGNNGTYRPVARIDFAGSTNSFSEWDGKQWKDWEKEQWRLQNAQTVYTPEGYQYRILDNSGTGFYLEPGKGQFHDGGRGDNAYVFVTLKHADKDEGDKDLVTIGPCCNIDYHQGPEKFIEPVAEPIKSTSIVIWYVAQMKNDDTKGHEYCWAESYLENGAYKTHVYPCMSGPMFIPVRK